MSLPLWWAPGPQASVGAACGLSSSCGSGALEHSLNSCGTQASLLQGMWGLPRWGLKSVSPALAGGFFTTEPPGKPLQVLSCLIFKTRTLNNLPKNYQLVCRQAQIQTQINLILKPYKVKVKVKSLSRVQLFATPWTVAHQAPPSMGFSRQEYWSGLPFPSPGDLLEPRSPALQADTLTSEPPGKPYSLSPKLHCHLKWLVWQMLRGLASFLYICF